MITVDSLERAPDALSTLEGTAQEASRESCASPDDETPAGGPPNANQVVSEAPAAEITIGPPLQARRSNLTIPSTRRARLPDRLMLGSYVKPMEWGHPLVDKPTPGLDEARSIIDRKNPFDKRDSSTTHMRELYPNLL